MYLVMKKVCKLVDTFFAFMWELLKAAVEFLLFVSCINEVDVLTEQMICSCILWDERKTDLMRSKTTASLFAGSKIRTL